jgi:hypothetical protein
METSKNAAAQVPAPEHAAFGVRHSAVQGD